MTDEAVLIWFRGLLDNRPIQMDLDYFAALSERWAEREALVYKEVSIGSWRPGAGQCYSNVDYWVKHHPQYTKVYGWLIDKGLACCAHAVVKSPDGALVNITPLTSPSPTMRFIRHIGSELEYILIRVRFPQYAFEVPMGVTK